MRSHSSKNVPYAPLSPPFAHYHTLHPGVIGMVRFAHGIVQGNVNAHLTADFEIAVHGSAPTAADFVL